MIVVIERLFSYKNLFLQPVNKGFPTGPDNLGLRVMNVCIDKAWKHEGVAVVLDVGLDIQCRKNLISRT